MGSLSDYSENAMIKHIVTEAAYSPAATIYLALCTADPTDAGTGASMNEVANSNAYARTAIAFGAASSRRVTQSGAVVFPEASGSWGTVTHWAIVTSATHGAGNMLAHGAFGSSFAVVTGNVRTVPTTEVYVEITASNGMSNYAANGFLDRMFRNQAFTVSANYLALVTVAATDSMTGSTITEPSGNNYARKQVNTAGGASPAWASASGSTVTNANDISFAAPSGSWGTIVGVAMVDASSTGNLLLYGNDVVDQAIGAESTSVLFPAGDFDIAAA
jgi:hypothetical protein